MILTSSLHEGHESLSLDDFHGTVHGSLVLDSFSWCHHHSSSDGVNGVGDETRGDCHNWKLNKEICVHCTTTSRNHFELERFHILGLNGNWYRDQFWELKEDRRLSWRGLLFTYYKHTYIVSIVLFCELIFNFKLYVYVKKWVWRKNFKICWETTQDEFNITS